MQKYRPDEFETWHEYWYGERQIVVKRLLIFLNII